MRKYNRKKKKKIDFVADNTPLVLSHLTPKQNTYARDFKKRKFFLLFFLCGEGGGPLPTSIIPSNRHLQNCLNAPFRSTGCNRGSNNRSEETRVMNQEKKQQRDESFFKKEKKTRRNGITQTYAYINKYANTKSNTALSPFFDLKYSLILQQ